MKKVKSFKSVLEYPKLIFEFERGLHFGGSLEYKITEYEDHMAFVGNPYNEFVGMQWYSFDFPKEAIVPLVKATKKARFWRKRIENWSISDGYGWTIKLNYKSNKISKEGYEPFIYPLGYRKIIEGIQIEIERLCETYSGCYDRNGIEERLEL